MTRPLKDQPQAPTTAAEVTARFEERGPDRPQISRTINVGLPEELIAWIDERVRARGLSSRAEFVCHVLDEHRAMTEATAGSLATRTTTDPGEGQAYGARKTASMLTGIRRATAGVPRDSTQM